MKIIDNGMKQISMECNLEDREPDENKENSDENSVNKRKIIAEKRKENEGERNNVTKKMKTEFYKFLENIDTDCN